MVFRRIEQMDADTILKFLGQHDQSKQAKHGSSITYYEGPSLAYVRFGHLQGTAFDSACSRLHSAAIRNRVHLVQRKISENWYEYVAISVNPYRT
jgi:hypothetical protein